MQLLQTAFLNPQQQIKLMELWNREYPKQLSYANLKGFEKYLAGLGDAKHWLIIDSPGVILGWAFTYIRKDDCWFAIIIASAGQKKGLGSRLINLLKAQSTALKGWVVDHDQYIRPDGEPYLSPLGFYLKNEFQVCHEQRLETDQLSAVKIEWHKP